MKNIPFSPPDITDLEINAVVDVLKSGWITTGPKSKEFERLLSEYCDTEKAVCLNSATAAMECTLRILGIGPGDEVVTSAYTYTASASVIHHTGATIRLCDVKPDSFEMDYDMLSSMINQNTKAIIPVDIAGKMCDYDKLFEIANSKKHLFTAKTELQKSFGRIIVIADAAHSFGAEYKGKKSGSVADFSCFSFHAVKNLTTAEGGAVTFNCQGRFNGDDLYKSFMLQALHGQTKDAFSKTQANGWEYDIIEPLFKCNMTDIMAAIGIAQLSRYQDILKVRRDIIEIYNNQFSDDIFKPLIHFDENNSSSGHLYLLRIDGISLEQRNEIINKMAENGVVCNVHYKPLPMLTAYKNLGFDIKNYQNAFNMYANEITLPLYSKMSADDAVYVAETLKNIIL